MIRYILNYHIFICIPSLLTLKSHVSLLWLAIFLPCCPAARSTFYFVVEIASSHAYIVLVVIWLLFRLVNF
jgi:hypothetical protein